MAQSTPLEAQAGSQNYFGSDDDDLAFAHLDADYSYIPAEGVEGGPIDFQEGLGGLEVPLNDAVPPQTTGEERPPSKPAGARTGPLRRTISTREMIEKVMEEQAAAEAKAAQTGDAAKDETAKLGSSSPPELFTAANSVQRPQHAANAPQRVSPVPVPKPHDSGKMPDSRPSSSKPPIAVGGFHFPGGVVRYVVAYRSSCD